MNAEVLNRANKLSNEIDSTKEMISALGGPYTNLIKAVNYRGDKETTKVYTIERDGKLFELILNHFKEILSEQQKSLIHCKIIIPPVILKRILISNVVTRLGVDKREILKFSREGVA